MFDNLTDRLEGAFKNLKGDGRLTEINIAQSIKEIRRALVAADVNYSIAKDFTDKIKDEALGSRNLLTAVKPGELMVKIVMDELTVLMGGQAVGIDVKGKPGVVLVAGLQGSGKTTFSAKLALHLKEKKYRANNLHMVKPIRIKNREYIREIYQFRYQRNIKNVLLFGLSLCKNHKLRDLKLYISFQLSLMFSKLGMESAVNFSRSWAPIKSLRECVSDILQTRAWGLETPFPGAALDIDNDRDYHAILHQFDEWKEYLDRLDQPHSLTLAK